MPADVSELLSRRERGAVEKLYITDFVRGSFWKCEGAPLHSPAAHINVSELRALCRGVELQARHRPNSRHMFLTDSLVVLGAAAKGRSSAPALNSLLRTLIPTLLGYNFYVGLDYVPTRHNPSDAPSRQRPVLGKTTRSRCYSDSGGKGCRQ